MNTPIATSNLNLLNIKNTLRSYHYTNALDKRDNQFKVMRFLCTGQDSCPICTLVKRINKPKSRWQKFKEMIAKFLKKEVTMTIKLDSKRGLL